jgi:hypothetical protein
VFDLIKIRRIPAKRREQRLDQQCFGVRFVTAVDEAFISQTINYANNEVVKLVSDRLRLQEQPLLAVRVVQRGAVVNAA